MTFCLRLAVFGGVVLLATSAFAVDYHIQPLKEAPPKEGLSPAIAKTLSPTGYKVLRGSKRTLCEIWLCNHWKLDTLKPKGDVIYPFKPGQLVGVVQFRRRGSDFRDQTISKGLYTMRFALQPVDGNHVGTSPTRDFLLLLDAKADKSAAVLDYAKLAKQSAAVAGSNHPALLCMQRMRGDAKSPAIREDKQHDWWILRLGSTGVVGDKKHPVAFDLVIVGQAAE